MSTERRSINHPVYSELKQSELSRFIGSIPLRSTEIQAKYSSEVQNQVNKFKEYVTATYSPVDSYFIFSALDLAIVAHEDNQIAQNRTRKELVNGEKVPYIVHPIGIAAALAGMHREVELTLSDASGDAATLPVHQHPYKAEVVVGGILHDVIEDVYLDVNGKNQENKTPHAFIGRRDGDIKWNELMREYFRTKNVPTESIEDVVVMVNAVTKYDSSTIEENVQNDVLGSPLYSVYTKRLNKLSPDQSPEERDGESQRILLDIHKIFRTTLYNEEAGKVEINSVTLRRFYGALAIKCQDIINNLESAGVKKAKIVRAHMLAHVARIFGLPSASLLGIHLIVGNNYDVFSDKQDITDEKIRMVRQYINHEANPNLRPLMKLDDISFVPNAVQMPINSTAEQRLSKKNRYNPALQYRVTASPEMFALLTKQKLTDTVFKINESKHTLVPIKTETQKLILSSGRKCNYYNAVDEFGKVTAIIRFQDNQPSAHTILSLVSNEDADMVPEHRILTPFDGTAQSTMRIIGAMSPFSLPKAA